MRTRKGWLQGYNCQAIVTESQIILSAEVTQDCNDVYQLEPMLKALKANLRQAQIKGSPKTVSADAGYWNPSLKELENNPTELLICTTTTQKLRKELQNQPPPRGRIPKDLSFIERMRRKLLTKRCSKIYLKRSTTVEPVFGQIKGHLKFKRFSMRGLTKVKGEWNLICSVNNILKLFRAGVVLA
jgi:hypothetical protein